MKFVSYKVKIIILSIIPLVFAVGFVVLINIYQTQGLGVAQSEIFQTEILQSKRNEIKNYMELAYTAIKDIYENPLQDESNAKNQVRAILKKMEFGNDGYFFIYDYDGINIAHSRKPELEGKNLYNFQDNNGQYVIQALIKQAKSGGGYTQYLWDKPSGGKSIEKIGYSIGLDKWRWMFGTGLYIDDIKKGINTINSKVKKNTKQTLLLTFLVTIAAILSIGLIGLMINIHEGKLASNKIRNMVKKTILFQEDERKRISRELHDGINQLLVSVRYRLETALNKLTKKEHDQAILSINKANDILALSVHEVRKISKDLRPVLLDDFGLFSAINSLSDEFYERTNICIEVNKDNQIKHLPKYIETAVYRITQEAFANIEKHAIGANLIKLSFGIDKRLLVVTIENNGKGFDNKKSLYKNNPARGMGIRNMQDRVKLLDGQMSIKSSEKHGTILIARLPIKES